MKAQLAMEKRTTQALELEEFEPNVSSLGGAIDYLKQHPNSELAMELMEAWLLDDANTYGHLNFEQELERLKNCDPVKNFMLENFIDGWLLKNGYLKANAEFVGKSYRRRLKELEEMKKKGRIGKFFSQVRVALNIVFNEKERDETISDLESVVAETVVARNEVKESQTRVKQATQEATEIAIKASNEYREKIEEANKEALVINGQASKRFIEIEGSFINEAVKRYGALNNDASRLRQEIIILEAEKKKLLSNNPELALALKIQTKPVKELQDTYSRTFWNTRTETVDYDYTGFSSKEVDYQTTPNEALLISSLCENGDHAPVLDLDFPVELIPSTTPGHFHLYLNKRIPWKEYVKLLKALYDVKLIEQGWYDLAIKKGQSRVLLPGIKRDEVSISGHTSEYEEEY